MGSTRALSRTARSSARCITAKQTLAGIHLRPAEEATLASLVADRRVSPSVVVGRALLALAAARGRAKGGPALVELAPASEQAS